MCLVFLAPTNRDPDTALRCPQNDERYYHQKGRVFITFRVTALPKTAAAVAITKNK